MLASFPAHDGDEIMLGSTRLTYQERSAEDSLLQKVTIAPSATESLIRQKIAAPTATREFLPEKEIKDDPALTDIPVIEVQSRVDSVS